MIVLGIDTSCDDTGVGVVRLRTEVEVCSNVVLSQTAHAAFGGVVPEIASREHVLAIDNVTLKALEMANVRLEDLSAIAVTRGPGLAGALLVGLNYAKGLAVGRELPFFAIHHLEGHIQAALVSDVQISSPYLALVVSGGHTHLFDVAAAGQYRLVGATRDDAAGEAFDKVARLLGLGYPGGPAIARAAQAGDPTYSFAQPLRGQQGFDFSFSGLKTAAALAIERHAASPADLAASFEASVVNALVTTTERAALVLARRTLIICGGVAANRRLREAFLELAERRGWKVVFPPADLNTDNGAMIALAGLARFMRGEQPDSLKIGVEPYLPLEQTA